MDLITVMTYISLLAVVVVLPKIVSNVSTSCIGPNVFNVHNGCDGYKCNSTFLDIFGLPERPRTLTLRMDSSL